MREDPGEDQKGAIKLDFDGHMGLEFRGAKVTTGAGLPAVRELCEAPALTEVAGEEPSEMRTGGNARHELAGLLRRSFHARLAGHEGVNDQEALTGHPAMRAVVGMKALERTTGRQTSSRFKTETPASEENTEAQSSMNHARVSKACKATRGKKVILDMGSSGFPVHGTQDGSSYNGHFNSRCYHPLFVFNRCGDCEAACLRPGNAHPAYGRRALREPVVDPYKDTGRRLYFRG